MNVIISITFPLVVYFCNYVTGYNLESRLVDFIQDPDYKLGQDSEGYDSYFGYSVAFTVQSTQDTNTTWLLIGAPRQSIATMTEPKMKDPGKVYKCAQQEKNASSWNCNSLHSLPKVVSSYNKKNVVVTRSWLGSTIVAENQPNGAVVICAAREKAESNSKHWIIPGKCYGWEHFNVTSEESLHYTEVWYKNKKDDEYATKYGLAMIGMSAHIVPETDPVQLVLGGPGLFLNTGGIGISEEMRLLDLQFYTPAKRQNDITKYLGYSVTSARFHKNGRVSYVSGAPRDSGDDKSDEYFTGTVYIGSISNREWELVHKLKGKQLGEYFGASLGVVDLNFDGIDDLLLVGAPYYSKRNSGKTSRDEGHVYVFSNSGEGQLDEMQEPLVGSEMVGAHFGSTIAILGDLDKDGFSDVAIGAPYEEEGKGAVYIYRGSQSRLEIPPCQKLSASEIDLGLRGFGISIASSVDLDENSFNDLVIGSYVSFNAVIVKSYPVVDIHAGLRTEPSKLNVMDSSFNISACLNFVTRGQPDKLPSISAEIAITVDPLYRRTILQGSNTNYRTIKVNLLHNTSNCTTVTARIMKKHGIKKNELIQPIHLKMEYKIIHNSSANRDIRFCKSCPMTDPHKPNKILSEVPITNGCKNITCQEKLGLLVEPSYNQTNPLVMGRHNNISLLVSISNSGDPAYSVMMAVIVPNWVKLVKLPSTSICSTEEVYDNGVDTIEITCRLLNPIMTNTTSKNAFELDVTYIPLNTKLITIMLKTWIDGDENNHSSVHLNIVVPVKQVSKLYISGNTLQQSIPVDLSTDNENNSIVVSHKYEVVNKGPSPVSNIDALFYVPIAIKRTPLSQHFLRLPYPKITVGSHTSTCDVDYKGWYHVAHSHWKDQITSIDSSIIETSTPNNLDETNIQRRRRRDAEDKKTNLSETGSITSQVVRRLSLDYLKTDVIHAEVSCLATFLKSFTEQRAEIHIQLQVDGHVIDSLLRNVDEVAFATVGKVGSENSSEISLHEDIISNNTARVETLFLGNVKSQIAPWIIPLSIVLGLLALVVLVKLLRKIGFFRRHDKEKLKLEKEKAAEEEFETEVLDCSSDSPIS